MLITLAEFREYADCVAGLQAGEGVALDLETTGLSPYHGDRAFLIGVDHHKLGPVSYFLEDADEKRIQDREALGRLLSNPVIRYAAHNIKFEMSFLRSQFQCDIAGKLWDTEVFERVLFNNFWQRGSYSLQKCAERRGLSKNVPMQEWLKVHGPKYHEAPKDLVTAYVEQDAHLSRLLMDEQIETFKHWDTATPVPIKHVVGLELKTTKALFDMEYRGIPVDLNYCQEALAYEKERIAKAAADFQSATGCELVDSRKCLAPLFDRLGIVYGSTEKGNASFSSESLLASRDHPVVRILYLHREATKRASTYWENFIALAAPDGKIHPSIHQTEAKTSRMSVRDPACQTWPDDSEDASCVYPIRRAFKPSHTDCLIVSMDWSQMELRLMVDEAGEMGMVEAFGTGADFHQQVADLAGVKRSLAKNGRFAKLYGAGVPKIASTLGIPVEVARKICDTIDETSPRIAAYTDELIRHCRQNNRMGFNWLGRRYFFDKGFEYKYPNYRVQGGCGEILRIAICDIDDFLEKNARPETRILLPIHDELVFNWHKDDLHLIPQVKQLMIDAFRSSQHLKMDASVTIGENFFDQGDFHG